jgi:hypothetical protein
MHHLVPLLSLALFTACLAPDEAADDVGPGGKADDHNSSGVVTLAQAGAFDRNVQPVAKVIRYGFLPRGQIGPGWLPSGEVPIAYDANGKSRAVRIPAGGAPTGTLVGFMIRSADQHAASPDYNYETWSADQFIDLSAPNGTLVQIPADNAAPFPFDPECYEIAVNGSRYPGRITHAFYGFTAASASDAAAGDVPWENLFGEPRAAGVLYPTVRPSGGPRGVLRATPAYTWVPANKNLVFRLAIDTYDGQCGVPDDTQFRAHAETEAYVVEIATP